MIITCHLRNALTNVNESSSPDCQSTSVIGPYSTAERHKQHKNKEQVKKNVHATEVGAGQFF